MKNFFLLLLIINFTTASAQQVNQCGIIVPPKLLKTDFSSVYEAGGYVNTMLDSINWKENFRLQEQRGINNAYATIIRNQRYIIYHYCPTKITPITYTSLVA